MSKTKAFERLIKFKQHTMPKFFNETITLLPNFGRLRTGFNHLDATIEEYIDKMPPLPRSPSPRRPVVRMLEENTILDMSHPLEGKLGGRRRTYRKRGRKQSRRRR
jgi:hypothetical protein